MRHLILLLLFALTSGSTSLAQTATPAPRGLGMEAILQQIATNNGLLQAYRENVNAQKLTNRAENNLPDPTVSYAHLWDSDDRSITAGELVVAQSFDFPTLYLTRSRLNQSRNKALDAENAAQRQTLLLEAKELCLDIVMLHQQQQLLTERLHNAEALAALYRQRLQNGDANRIDVNKVNLELLNARTEAELGQTALQTKLIQLQALNRNLPLVPGRAITNSPVPGPEALGLTHYTPQPLPEHFESTVSSLLESDASLQALQLQSEAAAHRVNANRQQWLPTLELGYRRNSETGHPLNGIVVGGSIPLFANKGKVKAARAEQMSIDYQKEDATLTAKTTLWQLYDEACQLSSSIKVYEQALADGQNLHLLKQALEGGEISLIEYFVEVSTVFDSKQNLLQLQNRYEKTLARLYKSRL